MSRKLPNAKSGFSNIVGAALLKWLSVVGIFLGIIQEFRTASAVFYQIRTKGFDLKSPFKSVLSRYQFEAAS